MAIIGLWVALGCQSSPVQKRDAGPLRAGDYFPQVAMPVPTNSADRAYLGLQQAGTFTLSDVQADVLVVEILNTHCYSCKKQARSNRKLFSRINTDPATNGRIKILGLAVGNSAEEVRAFREKYRVAYPIVPDPDFQLHRATGYSKTPYSLYIRKDPNTRQGRIIKTHLGANIHYERLFDQLSAILKENAVPDPSLASADSTGPADHNRRPDKYEIGRKVQSALCSLGGTITDIQELASPASGRIYAARLEKGGRLSMVFAIIENRTVPCDVCYDAHFLYVIDDTGKVLKFESIRLSKEDNIPWDENDVSLVRSRILGQYIFNRIPFEPDVDAVSSATITSQVVFDGLSDGRRVYEMLKEKGFLK